MNEKDRFTINQWVEGRTESIEPVLVPAGGDQDALLEDFCRLLAETAPFIKYKILPDEEGALPEIRVTDNITFSALPLENLLPPFLTALESPAGASPVVSAAVAALLEMVDIPVTLKLYVASRCPHCPRVLQDMIYMAGACPLIHLHVIEGNRFEAAAAEDAVLAAPCLILDNEFRWTGGVSMEEVARYIAHRDPSALGTATLRAVLEAGNADWICEKMKAHGAIFLGFPGLLTHEVWSVRLGAMVVVEALVAEAPALAGQLIPLLLPHFDAAGVTVKGDLLYALGEIGDAATAEIIGELMVDVENEDLKEAACDALAAIAERG